MLLLLVVLLLLILLLLLLLLLVLRVLLGPVLLLRHIWGRHGCHCLRPAGRRHCTENVGKGGIALKVSGTGSTVVVLGPWRHRPTV